MTTPNPGFKIRAWHSLRAFDIDVFRQVTAACMFATLVAVLGVRAFGEPLANPLRPAAASSANSHAATAWVQPETPTPLEPEEPRSWQAEEVVVPEPASLPPRAWMEQQTYEGAEEYQPPGFFDRFKILRHSHSDPMDPQRHHGVGHPLTDSSWRNRPWHASAFAGGLMGDELQEGVIDQGGGFLGGVRLGCDFDHYWGAETRLAFSDLNVTYEDSARSSSGNVSLFDVNLVHYPWGDTRWRPYLSAGVGIAGFKFEESSGRELRATAFAVPWGGGLKYLITRDIALRFELLDHLCFESGTKTDMMHNFSFTGGIEFHFGGRRTDYGSW